MYPNDNHLHISDESFIYLFILMPLWKTQMALAERSEWVSANKGREGPEGIVTWAAGLAGSW